jgi:hypothetical protein
MGRPRIEWSGLPGNRDAAMRAGTMPMTFDFLPMIFALPSIGIK